MPLPAAPPPAAPHPAEPSPAHGVAASSPARLAIIGLGPRGASLVERLGAHLSALPGGGPSAEPDPIHRAPALELHLIDDAQPGPGRIWRTDQPRELCMNTLADAVTLFTEPGSTVTGDVVEGPTLYEWCVLARETAVGPAGSAIPRPRAATFAAYPARAGLASDYREELASLRPESHPSRALYGEYLSWFFKRAIAELPEWVTVTHHRARAVAIERAGASERGGERITLRREGSGATTTLTVDAVIAATGWLPRSPTSADAALAAQAAGRADLTWVRQGSPVEQELGGIRPGEPVIVRGLGMGFFDTATLLTLGRGGRYVADATAPGGLRYAPSGREPVLHVTSRRGVPFRAKSRYGSLPPRAAQRLLREVDWAAAPRPINFDTKLWPRIVGDAFLAHAETLGRVRPEALGRVGPETLGRVRPEALGLTEHDTAATLADIEAAVRAAIAPIISGPPATSTTPGTLPTPGTPPTPGDPGALEATVDAVAAAVAPFIADPAERFDLAGELRPAAGSFSSPHEFDEWVQRRVAADLREVDLGDRSPVKAGLWSVSSARGVAQQIGTLGGFDAESRANGAALLTALGGMVGSGPPAFRNNELLALTAAGIVRFIGPEASVSVGGSGFVASSPAVAGSEVTARALIDAWMHFHDARASIDPFTLSLLSAGRARVFSVASRTGEPVTTGGIDIDQATGRIIGETGQVDDAVHYAGIPVDDTLHGTVISPMPGTDPPMLRETDRVALSALAAARRASAARLAAAAPNPAPAPSPSATPTLEGALRA
ncbi:FAD/NAD(P)-binding protein [Leucobacter albus]|uniref:FAD/NAD(P)-binding protein n=1 Tax=Leucobacter albus TaxID=272210 RepID=A0ABW3TMD2_9MICO